MYRTHLSRRRVPAVARRRRRRRMTKRRRSRKVSTPRASRAFRSRSRRLPRRGAARAPRLSRERRRLRRRRRRRRRLALARRRRLATKSPFVAPRARRPSPPRRARRRPGGSPWWAKTRTRPGRASRPGSSAARIAPCRKSDSSPEISRRAVATAEGTGASDPPAGRRSATAAAATTRSSRRRRRARRPRSTRALSRSRRGCIACPRLLREARAALRVVPYKAMSGWSSKASDGVERRRGRGLKARGGRRDAPGKSP